MRYIMTGILLALASHAAMAERVNGYTKSNGTYVQGYERSAPNGTVTDNYSYKGNSNPYSGSQGANKNTHDTTSPYYTGPNQNGQSGHSTFDPYR